MASEVRVSRVFVPGKLPDYTYNPRSELHLETQLGDYVEEAGSILTVAGPTKTGKSVLLRRVVQNAAWVDGQGIDDVDEMWRRIGDALGVYTGVEAGSSRGSSGGGNLGSEVGLLGVAKVEAQAEYAVNEASDLRYAIQRPISAVARAALEQTLRPLVIDDFHFIERAVQRQIVRALKPLVLLGVPVVLVSISHRVQDVVTAEPDMTGRVSSLSVNFWAEDELLVIARKGFEVLNVTDPGDMIARHLAQNSFGSPHLMQKFCREACKDDGVRVPQVPGRALRAPDHWEAFFSRQVDGASADWFQRLLRGPQERGSARTQWRTKTGETLDGYGLTLAAIAATGPRLTLSKDEIKTAVEDQLEGSGPAAHQTTRVLQHMSRIAATRITSSVPTEDELDQQEEPDAVPDVQPVMEYVEEGPNSALHIADPFFAFYLRWGSTMHLRGGQED